MTVNGKKSLFCIDFSKYRLITNCWNSLPMPFNVHNLPCVTMILFFTSVTMGHKACETVALLSQETPDCIPPSLWSPNSPDLNPVDYKVWGLLQKRVYSLRWKTSMISKIVLCRNGIDSTSEWLIKPPWQWLHGRVRACVAQAGGHFEYKLYA